MRSVLLGLLITVGMACIPSRSLAQLKTKPYAHTDTVIAIYTEPDFVRHPEHKLILLMLGDSRVFWSKHTIEGGQPYFFGHTDPAQITSVLEKLERAGIFKDASLRQPNVGPDAPSTVIFIKAGRHHLTMVSWHELFERNRNTVATHAGIVDLKGRNREEVLRREPAGYRKYRATWRTIRRLADGLIPATGKPLKKLPAEIKDEMGWTY